MNFFSYTNTNNNCNKAVSLSNIRAVETKAGLGKSPAHFFVELDYLDGKIETFDCLYQEEAEEVFNKIVTLLNKEPLDES